MPQKLRFSDKVFTGAFALLIAASLLLFAWSLTDSAGLRVAGIITLSGAVIGAMLSAVLRFVAGK